MTKIFALHENPGWFPPFAKAFEANGVEVQVAQFEEPQDGITLIQEFIQAAEPIITRVEIVGSGFIYTIQADTARGGFQLCPSNT